MTPSDTDLEKQLYDRLLKTCEHFETGKFTGCGTCLEELRNYAQAREHQLLAELMEQLPEKKDINIIGRIGGYSEEPLYVNGVSPHRARANAGYNYAINQVTALLEQKLQQRNDGGEK